jgi:hypothetical protein
MRCLASYTLLRPRVGHHHTVVGNSTALARLIYGLEPNSPVSLHASQARTLFSLMIICPAWLLTLLPSTGSPFLFPPRVGTVAPAMDRLQVIVRCGRLPRLRCRPKGSRVFALSVARPQFFKLALG